MTGRVARSPLILASASPRRLALLERIGVAPDLVVPAALDETPRPRELPAPHATRLAREKAAAVATLHPGAYVLAADTVVASGRRILPKAETEAEARRCLALLAGRRHRVLTAVCLIAPDGRRASRLAVTRVMVKRLSRAERDAYLASGEWRGKAGGYAIQGRAEAFIPWINGSYSNVVGLPLAETAALLAGLGYETASP
ncbi:MAG: nucleoside triphosphate pyrophosphatase [Alphaproteobacteria bacterium]